MSESAPSVNPDQALRAFVERVEQRVERYLAPRPDYVEQRDHLRHVADRTRWLYYSELNRDARGLSVIISQHEDRLIEACVFGHDIAKWIPRDELRALLPDPDAELTRFFVQLKFTQFQIDLFRLGVRRRYELPQDGYAPAYDSAHHLVSAFLLSADRSLGFDQLETADQERLISMIVGHQYGGYFKESLLQLSLADPNVSTGMIMEAARPDRVVGDLLASAFHDADISDLLFVGSLERRPNREEVFHTGGLVKILMINLTNMVNGVPNAPVSLEACLDSCQRTVSHASQEFITPVAAQHGVRWRKEARRFLSIFRERAMAEKLEDALHDKSRPAAERLSVARTLTHLQARAFLTGGAPDE